VEEPDPVTVVGLKLAVTPVGIPETLKPTVPVNPLSAPIVMPEVGLLPGTPETEAGEAESEKSRGPVTLSTPFEVVSEPALPAIKASTGLESWTAKFPLAVGARVIVTTAATPLPMGVVVMPVRRQVEPAQYNVFPAAIAAAPAAVVTDVVSPAGTFNVHCSPSSWPG